MEELKIDSWLEGECNILKFSAIFDPWTIGPVEDFFRRRGKSTQYTVGHPANLDGKSLFHASLKAFESHNQPHASNHQCQQFIQHFLQKTWDETVTVFAHGTESDERGCMSRWIYVLVGGVFCAGLFAQENGTGGTLPKEIERVAVLKLLDSISREEIKERCMNLPFCKEQQQEEKEKGKEKEKEEKGGATMPQTLLVAYIRFLECFSGCTRLQFWTEPPKPNEDYLFRNAERNILKIDKLRGWYQKCTQQWPGAGPFEFKIFGLPQIEFKDTTPSASLGEYQKFLKDKPAWDLFKAAELLYHHAARKLNEEILAIATWQVPLGKFWIGPQKVQYSEGRGYDWDDYFFEDLNGIICQHDFRSDARFANILGFPIAISWMCQRPWSEADGDVCTITGFKPLFLQEEFDFRSDLALGTTYWDWIKKKFSPQERDQEDVEFVY